MIDRTQIEKPVASEFKRFNDEFLESLSADSKWLQSAIETIMAATGKHVRPLLTLLSAKVCGGVTDNSINASVLLELLHTATLIHDDVVDETKQRRGIPSLNAIFDNRVAVLVGDYVLSSALIRSIQTGNLKIVAIISKLGRYLSEGEIKQLETAEESVLDETCYIQVIRKKTAMLLSACAEIGAISTDASDEMVDKCRQFGEYLGFAFQIKDDIFDYGDGDKIGKPTGNDIRERKMTLPLIYALKTASEEIRRELINIVKNHNEEGKHIKRAIKLVVDSGGVKYAYDKMIVIKNEALALLADLADSEAKTALIGLVEYTVYRDK